jgi:hypothetical protein
MRRRVADTEDITLVRLTRLSLVSELGPVWLLDVSCRHFESPFQSL